jgi:hypothetical protein
MSSLLDPGFTQSGFVVPEGSEVSKSFSKAVAQTLEDLDANE